MNINIIQKFDQGQFITLKDILFSIKSQNSKIMATQAELATQLGTIKATVDQIATDVKANDQAEPGLTQAVTDLSTSVDALRAAVPTAPAPAPAP
jgi:outer membrane murein-binding lipoprotein Lpp